MRSIYRTPIFTSEQTNAVIMKFTIEGQKGNSISWTTTQKVKHAIFSNVDVTISGMRGNHSVWVRMSKNMKRVADDLSLVDAIEMGNELITL